MLFHATVHIMPRDEILDPQGKATELGLKNLDLSNIDQVRIGRRIELSIDAADKSAAEKQVHEACNKLLANPIIEKFHFELADSPN
ncbi:MAG: phosphoribosylformylglycinamidine synthase subunit PurS [Bacteroidia bacterium]